MARTGRRVTKKTGRKRQTPSRGGGRPLSDMEGPKTAEQRELERQANEILRNGRAN